MIVGIPTETYPDERRVALMPASILSLTKAGLEVIVQSGAGTAAGFVDRLYQEKGARLVASREEVFSQADFLLQVRCLGANLEAGITDLGLIRPGQVLVGFMDPLGSPDACQQFASQGATLLAMELIPRTTRAQSMDALSSMASIAGYKAVLLAACALPKLFPMMMTAAGTLAPAKILVVGAGVAGLQAIASARRLGGVVTGCDVRPAVKEEVESLGARFLELPQVSQPSSGAGAYASQMDESTLARQRELMQQAVAASDVVITTAAVPGKKAPVLLTRDMVRGMSPGSLIVDLAAERGGNCELTQPGREVCVDGVTILGPLNVSATVPTHASQMYSRNISTLLLHLLEKGRLALKLQDEITRETLVAHEGQVVHPRVRQALGLAPLESGG